MSSLASKRTQSNLIFPQQCLPGRHQSSSTIGFDWAGALTRRQERHDGERISRWMMPNIPPVEGFPQRRYNRRQPQDKVINNFNILSSTDCRVPEAPRMKYINPLETIQLELKDPFTNTENQIDRILYRKSSADPPPNHIYCHSCALLCLPLVKLSKPLVKSSNDLRKTPSPAAAGLKSNSSIELRSTVSNSNRETSAESSNCFSCGKQLIPEISIRPIRSQKTRSEAKRVIPMVSGHRPTSVQRQPDSGLLEPIKDYVSNDSPSCVSPSTGGDYIHQTDRTMHINVFLPRILPDYESE